MLTCLRKLISVQGLINRAVAALRIAVLLVRDGGRLAPADHVRQMLRTAVVRPWLRTILRAAATGEDPITGKLPMRTSKMGHLRGRVYEDSISKTTLDVGVFLYSFDEHLFLWSQVRDKPNPSRKAQQNGRH